MKRFRTALPRSAYTADLPKLRKRQAELSTARKNTSAVYQRHCAAVAAQIRRELRDQS